MNKYDYMLEWFLDTELYYDYYENIYQLEKLRKEFVKLFPVESIHKMEIDDYVVVKKNETGDESFCYWLETKLMDLGKIKGGTTADKKFGVYYGSTKYDNKRVYRTIKKWSKELNPHMAFEKIKSEIVDLLSAGKVKNYKSIEENLISPMFKGKILSTYFPDDYLTIFSEKHVDYFIQILPIEYDLSEANRIIDKQNILLDFKNNDETMKDWSNHLFSKFLYIAKGTLCLPHK